MLCLTLIFAFIPNRMIKYSWICSVNRLWLPYQQSGFQRLDNMINRSCNWLWSMVSGAEGWYLLMLCLTLIFAFISNLMIKYSWVCSVNRLLLTYWQSGFQRLDNMINRSCNWLWSIVSSAEGWYLLMLCLTLILASISNLTIIYSWVCSGNRVWLPYQQPGFQRLDNMVYRSCNWLWSIVSSAEGWYLLMLCVTLILASISNLMINYSWVCSVNRLLLLYEQSRFQR